MRSGKKEMLSRNIKSWEEEAHNSDFRGFTHEDENGFIVRTKF